GIHGAHMYLASLLSAEGLIAHNQSTTTVADGVEGRLFPHRHIIDEPAALGRQLFGEIQGWALKVKLAPYLADRWIDHLDRYRRNTRIETLDDLPFALTLNSAASAYRLRGDPVIGFEISKAYADWRAERPPQEVGRRDILTY